ncbi:hypothetical protein [Mycobacteroides chelonae]|uniref:hypothetical protein n=1 Tax=Mycobacteroides chelonae TaxID=1774 RepID=UPI0008A90460|nr:hypothetical protein [Mycobacteroides chelonae]
MNAREREQHPPPWTDGEVRNINDFQRSGAIHPYTCGCGPSDNDGFDWPNRVLVAHNDGLHCPNDRCPVQTTHIYQDITDGSLVRQVQDDWREARKAAQDIPEQDDWDF